MSGRLPARGDIWIVNFDPIQGREQSGVRPALILSVDKFNSGPADLVVVLPITSKYKGQPLHVAIAPPQGGLTMESFVKVEDIRSVSKQRLRNYCGSVEPKIMDAIAMRTRILLGL
jgi:mRNA interferase MazF